MLICLNVKMNKGFTILEAIAAIFVMTVGVLGAYAVVQQIIVYNSISSSRLTAAYLAQEGIEIVRNIRDTNWLTVPLVVWDNGISSREEIVALDGAASKFKRKITIFDETDLSSPSDGTPDMFKVKVEVLWTEKGNDYTVAVEEHLYNWH